MTDSTEPTPASLVSRISVSIMPSVENTRIVSDLGLKHVELGPFKDPGSEPARGAEMREIVAVKEALE